MNLLKSISKFHHDEEGDVMQTVLVVAVAALVCVALKGIAGDAVKTLGSLVTTLTTQPVPKG